MPKTVAVITARDPTKDARRELERRLRSRMGCRGVRAVKVLFDPSVEALRAAMKQCGVRRLTIGWGVETTPDWRSVFRKYVYEVDLEHLLLYEISDLAAPKNQVRSVGDHVQDGAFRAVANGYFLPTFVPYGLERIPTITEVRGAQEKRTVTRAILCPGDSDELEVVRLIYDLFVHQDCSRTEILNLLNAQRVPAPGANAGVWLKRHLDSILTDPVYMGANRHGHVVAYNVGPEVASPFLYFTAQAKLFEACMAGTTPPGFWDKDKHRPKKRRVRPSRGPRTEQGASRSASQSSEEPQ
jgi:hypothetical protein